MVENSLRKKKRNCTQPFFEFQLFIIKFQNVEVTDRVKIVRGCIDGEQKSYKKLYDLLASHLLSVCHRYAHNKVEAEDIFQESFLKIYENLHQLREVELLEWWAKKIAVNEAIHFYKKKRRLLFIEDYNQVGKNEVVDNVTYHKIEMAELMKTIQQLPDKMRMVLNLYAIEGYKHEEIAELLQISVGTSKSNLFDARKKLNGMINEKTRKSL
jgi:RNA polymerase sigma-70 factor (ECF subfamily)